MPWVAPVLRGGLGNRLFQVAAALGYAERHGHQVCFAESAILPCGAPGAADRVCDLFPWVPRLPRDHPDVVGKPWTAVREPPGLACTFAGHLPRVDGHVLLDGYFQSERYFPAAGVHPTLQPPASALPAWLATAPPVAFLHVRRGDYLHPANRHHAVDLSGYYAAAQAALPAGTRVVAFSDDPAYVRGNPAWHVCDEPDPVATLWLMAACRGGAICANSTLSWWGAYLQAGDAPKFMPHTWLLGKASNPAPDIHPPWATVL